MQARLTLTGHEHCNANCVLLALDYINPAGDIVSGWASQQHTSGLRQKQLMDHDGMMGGVIGS
jgi:hypothetical protein